LIIERVLNDAVLTSKQRDRERKKEPSVLRENAKASTEGLHGHAVLFSPGTAVACLNNHCRFEGSRYTEFFV